MLFNLINERIIPELSEELVDKAPDGVRAPLEHLTHFFYAAHTGEYTSMTSEVMKSVGANLRKDLIHSYEKVDKS